MPNEYFGQGYSTSNRLNDIHNVLLAKYAIGKTAEKDKKTAIEIENVLRRIKNLSVTPQTEVDAILIEQAQEIMDKSLMYLNSQRRGGQRLSSNAMFRREHRNVKTEYGGDDIFEEELAAVISAIESLASSKEVNFSSKLVGSQSVNINLQEELEQIQKEMITKYVPRVTKKLADSSKGPPEKIYSGPVARSGKIDVTGTSTSFIEADLHSDIEKLAFLFQNRTFTVKNYASRTETLVIHLGNTDFYKAIYATLYDAGYSHAYINKVFFGGMNSYINKNNKDVPTHFTHMRFIYELTGVGLGTVGENLEWEKIAGADFFIYNDPSSNEIFVRSTAEMIYNEMQKDSASIFGGISIPKSMFS